MGLIQAAAAAFILTSATPALAQEKTPQYFVTADSQNAQLKKAFINRALHSNNRFACARAFYGPDYLLRNPLPASAYDILKELGETDLADAPNTYPFTNDRSGWCMDIDHGLCMILTASRRDYRKLLAFDPSVKDAQAEALANDPVARFHYYEKLVWDLMNEKRPTLIEGFANLREFASDPSVKEVFRSAMPHGWADYASIPKIAVGVLLKSRKPMKPASIPEEIENLAEKRRKNYYPIIYMGARKVEYPSEDRLGYQSQPADAIPAELLEALQIEQKSPAERSGFSRLQVPDLDTPEIREMLLMEPEFHELENLSQSRPQSGGAQLEYQSTVKKFAADLAETWIHVVAVSRIREIQKGVKWELDVIDPNAHPSEPNAYQKRSRNLGVVRIDLSNTEHPIVYDGVAKLYLDAFGELPGDREHMDEIVLNWTELKEQDPAKFERMKTLMQQSSAKKPAQR